MPVPKEPIGPTVTVPLPAATTDDEAFLTAEAEHAPVLDAETGDEPGG